jgi:hypothetical protein
MSRVFAAMEHFFIGITFLAIESFDIPEPGPAKNRPFPVNLIPEPNAHKSCIRVFISIKHDSSAT